MNIFHYNEKDGHTYTQHCGKWVMFPTHENGTIDFECMNYCDEDNGISEHDKEQVLNFISQIENSMAEC